MLLRADNIHTHYVKHRHAKRARVIFFLCDRSIRRTVYSNDLVKFFSCDVQHERNYEFMMYIRCYIGNGKP